MLAWYLSLPSLTLQCKMVFYYHMSGIDMGRLSVRIAHQDVTFHEVTALALEKSLHNHPTKFKFIIYSQCILGVGSRRTPGPSLGAGRGGVGQSG